MRYILPVVLALAALSCADHSNIAPVAVKPRNWGAVITRISSRSTSIVVRAGTTEPTYSLETSAGEVLVKDMTLGELATRNPELHDRVKTLQSAVLWAGD